MEKRDDELMDETRRDLEGAESSDDRERLETLEKVHEKLESELEERGETPPA